MGKEIEIICPICNGTGELREAVQAWDCGGSTPDCPYCDEENNMPDGTCPQCLCVGYHKLDCTEG